MKGFAGYCFTLRYFIKSGCKVVDNNGGSFSVNVQDPNYHHNQPQLLVGSLIDNNFP